jgi:SHS2 domain-containing protein
MSIMFADFEYIDHTADLGFKARGATLETLFVHAAQALFGVLVSPKTILLREQRAVDVSAASLDSLLVSWLNELLYIFEIENLLLRKFQINSMDERSLHAIAEGEFLDPSRHKIKTGIKAATYHQVYVEKRHGIWECRVFLDL